MPTSYDRRQPLDKNGNVIQGEYNSSAPTFTDGDVVIPQYNANGEQKVAISSDIELGQVELKDADSAAQANIKAANTARTATTVVLATQHIDAAGVVGGIRPSAYATDDSAMPATPAIMPMGAEYRASPTTYADGDATVLQTDVNGKLLVAATLASTIQALLAGVETDSILSMPARRADAFEATITSADATSATSVKAKTAAKSIYVTDIIISVDTAMSVQLQSDAGSPVVHMEQIYLPANSVFSKRFATPMKLATNVDLDVITSASGNISVTALGYVI